MVVLILQKLMKEEQGRYPICGRTVFNFYGLDDQIFNVTYAYNNRISGKRSIGRLAFQFIKVSDDRLGAVNVVRTREDTEIIYSSKTKTLMDAVYDWSRFNSLPRGFDWIKVELKNEPALTSELIDVTPNMATTRRIGFLLDNFFPNSGILSRLQRRLGTSSSLIPWIPDRSAKGKINRKWAIIING